MCSRGNSKYHYYGLRIKACSSLIRLMEDQQHLAMRQQPFSQKQRWAISLCLSLRLSVSLSLSFSLSVSPL